MLSKCDIRDDEIRITINDYYRCFEVYRFRLSNYRRFCALQCWFFFFMFYSGILRKKKLLMFPVRRLRLADKDRVSIMRGLSFGH